jgi:hypothetical protein
VTRSNFLAQLRSLKHGAWLARKRAWSAAEPAVAPVIDTAFRAYSSRRPPAPRPSDGVEPDPAPRRIFCLWTGANEMSANRTRAMREIRRLNHADVDVVLVTPDNLCAWVVPEHPLHRSYENLALIHRADYLRTYLMHHHGGGYSDVKATTSAWSPMFEQLNSDPGAWILGYREPSYRYVAPAPMPLRRQLQVHHARLLGNGAYIVKPRTSFTRDWLHEAERRLEVWADALVESPGDVFSGPPGYPVPFYGLLGEIFHPLCLRHHDRLRHDARMTPQLQDYK